MIKNVGLIDYDSLINKKYIAPNYELGLTYGYLRKDPNLSVKLVTSLMDNNLDKYDKIYIFKNSPYSPHPSAYINNYYGREIEEYGPGFINKKSRPYMKETFYSTPDFTCYNPILSFSYQYPKHFLSWKLNKAIKAKNHQQVKLFELVEGEYLRRDIPSSTKKLVVHDNPNVILKHANQLQVLEELLNNKYQISFIQPLDISLIQDTNIIERVIKDKKWSGLRKRLLISQWNDSADFFVSYCLKHNSKRLDVLVLYEKGKKKNYYLCSMLTLNYYNNLNNYYLRLRPYWDKEIVALSPLTRCLYRFLYEAPYLMSFYEYVFYVGCKTLKVPERLINTNAETYGFILQKYGISPILKELEDWLIHNPEFEDYVFIGGSSNYGEQRKRIYDARRSKYAFGRSPNEDG